MADYAAHLKRRIDARQSTTTDESACRFQSGTLVVSPWQRRF
jgi:hypothetical protein